GGRHTRSKRDWSSDVCSSDLDIACGFTQNTSPRALDAYELAESARDIFGEERVYVSDDLPGAYAQAVELAEDAEIQSGSGIVIRSEERRVGKERRPQWGTERS